MAKHDHKHYLLPPSAPLSLSDERLANLLESITDGFCLLDHDWTIRYINTRGADMLAPQRPPGSQLAGSSLWQACPHLQGTELETQYRRAMAQQHSCSVELLYPPLGRWLEVRIFPSSDGLTTYIQDISQRKAAEESLRHSEEDLRALANSIPQLAWIASFDGTIAWYNQRWHDYTGTSAEQMAGEGWSIAYDARHLPSMLQAWKTALRDGTPFEMEFPIRGADGQYRWFLTRANPVRDRGGRLLRWFGTSTDVDQVKRAQEALCDETRVLELLNNTGAALAGTLDLPALLQETVDAATRISGARFGALYYDDAGDVHDSPGALPAARAVNGISLRQADTIAAELRQGPAMRQNDLLAAPDASADGTPPLRSCLSLPVSSRSGLLLGRLLLGHTQAGMFSARSERIVSAIAAQAAVALDNTRLYAAATRAAEERKVLLDSEREARAEAERTNQLKDDFLATLSHELRTPLSAILGWAQVLRRGTRDQADLHRGLQSIERNARAQAQLIEDLLDMNRITSDKVLLDLQPLAPASIIASAIETLRPAADAKHIAIHSSIASDAGTMVCRSSRTLSDVMRLMSSKSSISCACARALRSMLCRPRCRSAWSRVPRRSTCAQPRMADSGVRSSCDRVVRKSSFSWFVRSASARASRSLSSSTLRSSAARVAAAYRRVLSSATAAWAAMADTMRSLRALNMPACGWPSSKRPSNRPEREMTGRLRQLRSGGAAPALASGAASKSFWRMAGPWRSSVAMASASRRLMLLTARADGRGAALSWTSPASS